MEYTSVATPLRLTDICAGIFPLWISFTFTRYSFTFLNQSSAINDEEPFVHQAVRACMCRIKFWAFIYVTNFTLTNML
jgi:hypothetical protein